MTHNKKRLLSFAFVLMLGSMVWGQPVEKSMSLQECIVGALKNNLGLKVEVLNPQLADLTAAQANEIFFPSLTFEYNKQETNTPSYSWIDAANQVIQKYYDYSAQLTQLIPTGGNLDLTFYSYSVDTSQRFQTINPRYGSQLRFNFTQPLLKDFGLKVTRREIIIANNNTEISEKRLRQAVLDTVYNVEEAYWNLVYSVENLKALKRSLRLAQDLMAKNKKEVEVGMMAPIEVLSAQAEVARREADILQAEELIKSNEDHLKTIMNLAAEERIDLIEIVPNETPSYEEKEVTIEEALEIGKQYRPDLQVGQIELESRELNLSVARNQLLPSLNFQASYWSPGVSGDQILYLNDDPLTEIVVGTVPGGASNAFKDAFNFKYRNWAVGLTLSIPINSVFSRAQYARAQVDREQAQLNLENTEQQAFLEIRDAVRRVQTDYKRVQAYKVARELAQQNLEAEEKKLKVGLTTNYQVLLLQRDLADAHSLELRATIDYNLALAGLDRATGVTLNKKNIKMTQIWSSDG
jgi:outer membrane protein TolC